MNNRKTGLALSYGATILNMVCGLFLSSFLLRSLGDFEYGLYQTISAFVNYLVVLEFGVGTVMTRNLLTADASGDPDGKKKVTATLFYMTLVLGAVILLVGIVFGCSIQSIYAEAIPLDYIRYAEKMFAVMLGYLLVSFATNTLSGVFLGNENYNIGNGIKLIKTLLRTLALVVAVSSVRSAMVIAVTDMVISGGVLLFTLWYVKRKYVFSFRLKYFDTRILKESMPLCLAMLLQAVINQANSNVDKMVISIKMSMESVSLYSVAMYIYSMFSSITTIPVSLYLPQTSKNIQKGLRGQALTESMVPAGRLVAVIGGGILFGFAAVGRQFISIFYGAEYLEAWAVTLVILVPMFVNMTGGNVVNVLDVLNKRHIRSYMLAVTMVLNIAMTIVFVDHWGVLGAAVATGLSLILGQLLMLNLYYQKALDMNLWWLYGQSYRGILLSELLAMASGGAVAWLIADPFAAFLAGGLTFVAVDAIALWLFGLRPQEKQQLKKLLHR